MKNLIKSILFTLVLALALPSATLAASFQSHDRALISLPISDDFYVGGGHIQIESDVDGDLFAAGGDVYVSGDVAGDLAVAGGQIFINGNVADDVRIAGGDIDIYGEIGDDLIVTGGRVHIFENAVIHGDLLVSGGQIIIDGTVKGSALSGGGEIIMNGDIEQNAQLESETLVINGSIGGVSKLVADEIILEPNASFGGAVEYWSLNKDMDFGSADATYNPELREIIEKESRAEHGIGIFSILSASLAIFVLLFARKRFGVAAKKLEKNALMSFGAGILYFIVMPIIALLLLITIIGIPFSLLVMAIYAFSILFAKVLASVVLASALENRGKKKWSKLMLFAASLGAYIILRLVTVIPVVGWLIAAVAIISAFGALLISDRK